MKNPWFKFYGVLFEHGTRHFSPAEAGAYIRLLIYQSDQGFVPNVPKIVRQVTGIRYERLSRVLAKFDVIDGKLVNAKMKEVLEDQAVKSQINRANGSKGGKQSAIKAVANAAILLPIRSSIKEEEKEKEKEEDYKQGRPEAEPIGMDKVRTVANLVWKDKAWLEAYAMSRSLSADDLGRWMNEFNLSVSQSTTVTTEQFTPAKYKNFFRVWVMNQMEAGRKPPMPGEVRVSEAGPTLKRI